MSSSIEIDADALIEGLDRYATELEQQMKRAMRNAGAQIAARARTRAPQGETGHLRQSIQGMEPEGSFIAGTLIGGVVALAPYAEFVESGTRAHIITPRFRKSLRFPVAGGFAFARVVRHPGTQAQPFMQPALDEAVDRVAEEFQAAADLAAIRAGFG